jgi:glucokinase
MKVVSAALTLIADIGGTHARFALADASAQIRGMTVFKCTDYAHLELALDAYFESLTTFDQCLVDRFCIAVAAPVETDLIKLTNHSWVLSRSALSEKYAVPVSVINDFSAQAWCLSSLRRSDIEWIQSPQSDIAAATQSELVALPAGTRTIAGPGTGFGGASLTSACDILSSEPGHVAFAPLNELQLTVLRHLWRQFPRVSVEHLISGPGLANIYSALSAIAGQSLIARLNARQIVTEAGEGDRVAIQSLTLFSSIFGSVCGDMALSIGCNGGLFISGDMLKKMGIFFDRKVFMDAFLDKGPFSQWCENIPIAMFITPDPGLRGCALYANRIRSTDGSI